MSKLKASIIEDRLSGKQINVSEIAKISETVIKISSVSDIASAALVEGQAVDLIGYHEDTIVGGGYGVIKTAKHNGGTAISLTRAFPTVWGDNSMGEMDGWFADSDSNELCFVRTKSKRIDVTYFGYKGVGGEEYHTIYNALSEANNGGTLIFPHGSTFKLSESIEKINIESLTLLFNDSVMDFQCDMPLKFGDFSVDENGYFTQINPTVKRLRIKGLISNPLSGSGWDGTRFSYANPVALSSCEDVKIRWSNFQDQHVAAIDISAKSKNVKVLDCKFKSTEEAGNTYGVRPFLYNSTLEPLDIVTGELTVSAPSVYHEDILVERCEFEQIGRSIVSWNVHRGTYKNNVFKKPLVRTISATNWNFDTLIQGNRHIAEDNTSTTLSTFINVGVGSKDVRIFDEMFEGTLSGAGINASLKCVNMAKAEKVQIKGCTFDVIGAAIDVYSTYGTGFMAKNNDFNNDVIPFSINEINASAPTYNQPDIGIINNDLNGNISRSIVISANNSNSTGTINVRRNSAKYVQTDGFVAFSVGAANWRLALSENKIKPGSRYILNNGGAYSVDEYDVFTGFKTIAQGTNTTSTLSYRDYFGDVWFVTLSAGIAHTITDITDDINEGQKLTIISGAGGPSGSITLPQGNFRNKTGTDKVLTPNETACYVSRSGLWFEV